MDKEQTLSKLARLPESDQIWTKLKTLMDVGNQRSTLDLPTDMSLPIFVYGALKPGMPAYEQLRDLIEDFSKDAVSGELYVRDGLPLLSLGKSSVTEGFLLRWNAGFEDEGYARVCQFEPRSQYQWGNVELESGNRANVLTIRDDEKGNPLSHGSSKWNLQDDAAFGAGLDTVETVMKEVDDMSRVNDFGGNLAIFFRSQMAYLLLWSILERLTAFCFGPSMDPMKRINKLHELPGMEEFFKKHVKRSDKVSDSRDPRTTYRLDACEVRKSFQYYYQVRSNLSHRGKGVFKDFNKVHVSLRELLAITRDYLNSLSTSNEDSRR